MVLNPAGGEQSLTQLGGQRARVHVLILWPGGDASWEAVDMSLSPSECLRGLTGSAALARYTYGWHDDDPRVLGVALVTDAQVQAVVDDMRELIDAVASGIEGLPADEASAEVDLITRRVCETALMRAGVEITSPGTDSYR